MLLHFPCKRRKRSVFEAVGHLAAHIAIGERLARGDKVGLDGVIVAPHDLFERTALRPVQALDGKVQKRRHHAACAAADLRKLSAVEKRVVDGDFRLRQKCRREVRADGRGHDERKACDALRCQERLHLPNLIRFAGIFLPFAVDGRGRQDAEILVPQIFCDWLAARARHTHRVEKEHGGCALAAKCFKLHGNLTSGYIAAGRRSQRPVKIFQWIKSVITPASTAAMTAIPSVPKSHFLRLTLLGI